MPDFGVLSPRLQTTAYVLSPDRRHVLLMRRDKWAEDIHYGKYMGLGGHVEPGEDVVACIQREIEEESGLAAIDIVLRGTVLWTGFGPDAHDALCFVFRVDSFRGKAHAGNEEGTLEWVPIAEIADLPMWDSDNEWLPMVFDDDPRQFHGVMPYDNDQMLGWTYQRI